MLAALSEGREGWWRKLGRRPTSALYETPRRVCSPNMDPHLAEIQNLGACATDSTPFGTKATFRRCSYRNAVPSLQYNVRAMLQVPLMVAFMLALAAGDGR
jgi:hypothetical protein